MRKLAKPSLVAVSVLMLAIFSRTVVSRESAHASLQISASGSRDGTCSAALADGRSFVTGGSNSAGTLSTAKYFGRNGQFIGAAPMLTSRRDHLCVALDDATILVADGDSGKNGPTNSAEIFHTDTNQWTPTGPMLTARRRAATVLLRSGMVLVAGGEVAGQTINTLEIYDPAEGRFEHAVGVLSAARTGYALAALNDGRVLIAGGFEGARALDSIDMFDPALGVIYAGRMSTPRANFTATTLSDGNVLFTGGTDGPHELASAEVYDPSTGNLLPTEPLAAPRQNHIAVRPADSDIVLIAGGKAAGKAVDSAEFFVLSRNAFEAAPETATQEKGGRTITVASLNRDATVRAVRTYRL